MRKLCTAFLSTAALFGGVAIQPATAADLAVKAPPPAVPIVSRWDGLYASFSAGGSWTEAKETFSQFRDNTTVITNAAGTRIIDTVTNSTDSQNGNDRGAVFTFAMGYNVVWGGWLAGIQSEVSLNRNNIRTTGTQHTNQSQTDTAGGGATFSAVTTQFNNLDNRWTISEMARLGYLVTPNWLVYGLVGWSMGGFEWNNGATPFTMNGLTWGAGVEKDFGWLRAFVQYKGISYGSHSVNFSAPSSNITQFTGPAETQANTVSDRNTRRFSADVNQVTAGITIPINFNRF